MNQHQHAFPIVITGHVDHGKSTFIGRLLYDTGNLQSERYQEMMQSSKNAGLINEFAFIMDVFEEERKRGITIDTSQIFFKTKNRSYLIIDAPGHREFIRNMITGAGYAEAAILIIDAREGIMEQTKRHVWLLNTVGIQDICVVLNKMDIIEYSEVKYQYLLSEVNFLFNEFNLIPAAILPISAKLGINIASRSNLIPWYKGPCFLEVLENFEKKPIKERPFRMPVQDIYNFDGEELIAGKIESGSVSVGMKLQLLPQKKAVIVSAIRKFPVDIETAFYGAAIAVKLDGSPDLNIIRGNVLAGDEEPLCGRQFQATVFWFYDEYKSGGHAIIRCTTQAVPCSIILNQVFDPATPDKPLSPAQICVGEVAYCTITAENDIIIDHSSFIPEMGRFVIECDNIPKGAGIFR